MRLALLSIALSAVSLGACTQTAVQTPASTNVTAAGFRMPDGAGCQGEIDRYRAIMTNDLAMGHVTTAVYGRVETEINRAQAACTAGRDAEALRMVDATKGRHGYR